MCIRDSFWTGLLLLVRAIIFILSAANTEGDPTLNLGIITLTVLLLLSIALMLPQGLYGRHCLNILECCLLLNLGVLSITTALARNIFHQKDTNIVILFATHLCVGTAFITFIGIALYHICRIEPTRRCLKYIQFRLIRRYISSVSQSEDTSDDDQGQNSHLVSLFDQEREPLI